MYSGQEKAQILISLLENLNFAILGPKGLNTFNIYNLLGFGCPL